jgi:hypothetical protein
MAAPVPLVQLTRSLTLVLLCIMHSISTITCTCCSWDYEQYHKDVCSVKSYKGDVQANTSSIILQLTEPRTTMHDGNHCDHIVTEFAVVLNP